MWFFSFATTGARAWLGSRITLLKIIKNIILRPQHIGALIAFARAERKSLNGILRKPFRTILAPRSGVVPGYVSVTPLPVPVQLTATNDVPIVRHQMPAQCSPFFLPCLLPFPHFPAILPNSPTARQMGNYPWLQMLGPQQGVGRHALSFSQTNSNTNGKTNANGVGVIRDVTAMENNQSLLNDT